MAHLYIVRGLPGSGKSTFAKTALRGMRHYETDMFFQGTTYGFDASRLGEAHAWCQKLVAKNLKIGYDVVVSNTFTRIWEMQPYFDMGYDYTVITVEGNHGNVHGVPPEVVEAMRARWEPYRP